MSEEIGNLLELVTTGEWGNNQGTPGGIDTGVIRSANITKDHQLNTKEIAIRSIEERKRQKKMLRHGDILIEKSGGSPDQPVGRVLFYDLKGEHTCSNFISILRPSQQVDAKFLYYSLCNLYERGVVKNYQQQTTGIINLQLGEYLRESIYFPPLPEQKKIAEILSGIDNLIASKERQISALKNLQKSLLDALVEDQLGSGIPCVELNDVISPDRKITYGIVQAGPHTPGGIPYIRVTDMSRDQLEPNEMLRTTEELAVKFKRSEVKEGDVVVALRGIIGASHLIDKRAAGCNLTQGTALLSRSEKCDPCYLNTILKSEYCRRQFAQLSKGSTIVEITLSSLGTIKVPLPERVEQERTARIVDAMQSQIRHSNEMLSSYKNLKVAISSDLLSGRKRVTL
jgi:type I restriction enzyme S subunit